MSHNIRSTANRRNRQADTTELTRLINTATTPPKKTISAGIRTTFSNPVTVAAIQSRDEARGTANEIATSAPTPPTKIA